MSDLDFDLSRSPKVKPNGAIGLPTCASMLVSDGNYMSISHRLGVLAEWKFFT